MKKIIIILLVSLGLQTQAQISWCDSLVYDGSSWVLMNMGNPTTIKETRFNVVNNDKIYDLLGRELDCVPVGKMYIRNNKLYISK